MENNNLDSSLFKWDDLLSELKLTLDPLAFESWINPLRFDKVEGNIIYIISPSQFIKNWVITNFNPIILSKLGDNWPYIKYIDLRVSSFHGKNDHEKNDYKGEDNHGSLDHHQNFPHGFSASNINNNSPSPFQSSADNNFFNTLDREQNRDYNPFEINLNLDYTFENFVVGKPNEFAYNAARRVAEDPKINFNPLFIYGGVGLGKTHLMHAIALKSKANNPIRKCLYLTAEKFMNLFITALRDKEVISFKEIFRSTDILMIDDFQFISGKEQTQEEFFHTFNTLISQGKQIILSADKSPLSLDRVEERIISRLQAGLSVDIHATTYELRIGILESKIKQMKVKVPREIIDFLAHTITSNVRELEGGLKRIISYQDLMNTKIDLNMAMVVLEDILKSKNKIITIDLIQKKVAEYYSIKLVDMSSAKKDKTTSMARHIAMYIAKKLTRSSLPEIGRKFGGRDHTTVLYSVKKIDGTLKIDTNLSNDINLLINIIQKS
ncbi:Chromosomal replication initiator protein DnaA [Candidatus Hepatincolaceae symbiont of Richtersius coronifer]